MNVVSLIGRMGNDPQLQHTANGKSVLEFRLAVESPVSDTPDWITIVVWGKDAEVIAEHKRQGDQIAVTGRLTSQQWETDDGQRRSTVKVTARPRGVQFLARRRSDSDHSEA